MPWQSTRQHRESWEWLSKPFPEPSSGAGTSQPPPSVLTCTLDFFFAFSTDLTVSPAADRAAIRDSISEIFRRRRKDTQMVVGGSISGFVCHQWPGKASLRAEPSPRSLPAAPEQLLRPLCPPAPTAPSRWCRCAEPLPQAPSGSSRAGRSFQQSGTPEIQQKEKLH